MRSGECSEIHVNELYKLIPAAADRQRLELLAVQDFVLVIRLTTMRWAGLHKRYVKFVLRQSTS
jgi:hypothetical protein